MAASAASLSGRLAPARAGGLGRQRLLQRQRGVRGSGGDGLLGLAGALDLLRDLLRQPRVGLGQAVFQRVELGVARAVRGGERRRFWPQAPRPPPRAWLPPPAPSPPPPPRPRRPWRRLVEPLREARVGELRPRALGVDLRRERGELRGGGVDARREVGGQRRADLDRGRELVHGRAQRVDGSGEARG